MRFPGTATLSFDVYNGLPIGVLTTITGDKEKQGKRKRDKGSEFLHV